jgi:hypothetical protein
MNIQVSQNVPDSLGKEFDRIKGLLFFKKGAGFLGRILAQVEFMWTDDMPTAAISHKQLFWSPKFFESLDQESRVTILAMAQRSRPRLTPRHSLPSALEHRSRSRHQSPAQRAWLLHGGLPLHHG